MEWKPIAEFGGLTEMAYLVWDGAYITVASLHGNKWFVHNSYGFNEDGEIYDITHWMELPNPPTEGAAPTM